MGKSALIWKIRLLTIAVFHLLLSLFTTKHRLYRSRWARPDELWPLLTPNPRPDSLLLGVTKTGDFVGVSPTETNPELGSLLIVGRTRSGKGLHAKSQLLSSEYSIIVNDIKGELSTATAGYRKDRKDENIYYFDPLGYGHTYDPFHNKETEDEFYSLATQMLFQADEGEGKFFTDRAIDMLTQMFLASRIEGIPPLPYVRYMIRLGCANAAIRLQSLDPELATQFLDTNFEQYAKQNFHDKVVQSCFSTLKARLKPMLTETVIRSLTHSDSTAEDIMCSEKPVTVYLRWPERHLLALSPLIRLMWGSLIDELCAVYDKREGKGCRPVLLLIDEAGRTAIPMLADQSTTIVGRRISLLLYIQSLSQLETVYGRSRAQTLRDNMDSQIFYRPTDLQTAIYLEERLGMYSAEAYSTNTRNGEAISEGKSERAVPLLSRQDIMQMRDEEILAFHRNKPPMQLHRCDYRKHPLLAKRHNLKMPPLTKLPPVTYEFLPTTPPQAEEFVDPDLIS